MNKSKLYGIKIDKSNDFIEIGGGNGNLSFNLKKRGFNLVLFVEPDKKKFLKARSKLFNTYCINSQISSVDLFLIKKSSTSVTVILQDVIEHIKIDELREFFKKLSSFYQNISLIGRTPNLKSPFGLRNSFGDNTHIYRFTDHSLRDFLLNLDFYEIIIKGEEYQITGITSMLRYLPYQLLIGLVSISFLVVFGSWEGILAPNIVFKSSKKNDFKL